MENIIPSENRANEDTIRLLLEEGNLKNFLIEKAELNQRLKIIDIAIKERRIVLQEAMKELNVKTMSLGLFYDIVNVSGSTREKVLSAKAIKRQFPDMVEELISEVEVSGYVAVKRK